MIHGVKDRFFVDKPHLNLCGMHIHIHRLRRQLQVQYTGRKAPDHDHAVISALQRHRRRRGLNISAVDEKVLHGAVGARSGRVADKARNMHALQRIVHTNGVVGKILAEHRIHTGKELSVPRREQFLSAVPQKAERNFWMGQRDALHHCGNGVALADILFEKLHAGRHIEEQIRHRDGRPLRCADLLILPLLATDDAIGSSSTAFICGLIRLRTSSLFMVLPFLAPGHYCPGR